MAPLVPDLDIQECLEDTSQLLVLKVGQSSAIFQNLFKALYRGPSTKLQIAKKSSNKIKGSCPQFCYCVSEALDPSSFTWISSVRCSLLYIAELLQCSAVQCSAVQCIVSKLVSPYKQAFWENCLSFFVICRFFMILSMFYVNSPAVTR